MDKKTFQDLLKRFYEPYAYMRSKYPKAAKKKRIQNKWRNRFGKDVDWEEILTNGSWIDKLPKMETWGTSVITPFITESEPGAFVKAGADQAKKTRIKTIIRKTVAEMKKEWGVDE